ncbi:hypothetical protein [Polaromonas sp.]|uniref:hypothetical protein n=1 Tax=Polaromonas sp. TaxID=1869339 RepID=UPI00352BC114
MPNGMQAGLTRDQLRNQLLSQYTKQSTTATQPTGPFNGYNDAGLPGLFEPLYENGKQSGVSFNGNNQYDESGNDWLSKQAGQTGSTSTSTVDEEGLNAAIEKYYADQAAQEAAMQNDPNYGSLLRAYRNGAEFDSGPAFSFTGADLKNEPGYKFGLDQGTQGIERGQASRGNFLSGAAMKELTRFNEDYAGTKFDAGFNRASATYGTNLARRQNEWNTNLGAYNQNRNTIYNFLTGASGTGQASAARVGTNNQQTANAIGGNTMAAGVAQSAGTVASGNALASGFNQLANNYGSNNPSSAAGWNSLITAGGSPYGASATSVSSGAGYTPYTGTNVFASGNGMFN